MSELRYTKDGVPIFDGAPELFVAYKRAALVYAETIEWKKRTLVGPRLQAALEGSAKIAVEHMPPGWVSHEKGAWQLLDYLRLQVRAPTLAEAGRTMARFFYGVKRRRGEGMAAWIVRHDEALLEAKRTLAEAIHEYGPSQGRPDYGSSGRQWMSQPSLRTSHGARETGSTTSERRSQRGGGTPLATEAEADAEEPEQDEENGEAEDEWGDTWWQEDNWSWHGWNSQATYGPTDDSWKQKESMSQRTWDVSEAASKEAESFLPDFVIAWLLLQRSGLDATDKSVIVANLKNQFRTDRVKEALKLTWPDEELRKRDAGRGAALFSVEEAAMMADEDEPEEDAQPTWEDPSDDYAYQALEAEAQEAYATVVDAKRTLREAREKQAMMRRNRNFYSGKGSGKGNAGKGSSFSGRPPPKCFRCGGPHFRRDCPQQEPSRAPDQGANLVFMTTQEETNGSNAAAEPEWLDGVALAAQPLDEHNLMVLDRVIQEGKAIIDGGATSSLGSEDAVQRIAELNWEAQGSDGLEILPGEAPAFRFGNNGRHECMSTALLNLNLGGASSKMKVHLHDIPGQPVLLSVKGLKALGAVIDFDRDEAIFKNVNPWKVAQLETTESGHQLFPLAKDALEGSSSRSTAFRTLHGDVSARVQPAVE